MRNGPDRRAFLAWAAYTAASRCVTAGPPPENCNLPTNLIQSLPEGKAFTPETTVLPRRTISSLTGSELGKLFDDLTRAYTVLKSRSDQRADDPTGLLYQGWLHDYYCGSGGHDVHRSWFFLPWHRAFVYFHELILRGILGDHFRLPVWDWENVDAVPYFYRNWAASHGCEQFSVGLNGKVVSCSLQAWLLSETPGQDFLGTDQQSGNAQAGPHTFVHSQIGGLLADPKTAAADPLFYAHHTNVDRFWCYWRRHYQFGDRPEWLQKSFCFFDGHGQPVKITVQDLVSEERLGYQYPQSPTVDLYPFQTVIGNLSGAARAVSFPTPDLNRFLNLPVDFVEGALGKIPAVLKAGLVKLQSLELPLRVSANLPGVSPGKYYFVGMVPIHNQTHQDPRVIGGFGQFGSPKHSGVVATGCIHLNDLEYIFEQGGQVRLVYGPPDPTMTTISVPKLFWPVTGAQILFRIS